MMTLIMVCNKIIVIAFWLFCRYNETSCQSQIDSSTQHLINSLTGNDPDFNILTPDLITGRGYGYELHAVHTSGGFILALHRIVNPSVRRTRSAVLMFHGIVGTADSFLNTDAFGYINEQTGLSANLAFELAKVGHDVFLLDQRATLFSANNTKYDYNDPDYWSWSLDDIALFDLPATIDYMRKITGRKHIAYIGHSQATTAMFMLMSKVAKYNRIIRPFIALGPVFFQRHTIMTRIPGSNIVPFPLFGKVLASDAVRGPAADRRTKAAAAYLFCTNPVTRMTICQQLIYLVYTFGSPLVTPVLPNLNYKRLPVFLQSSAYDVFSQRQIAQMVQASSIEYPSFVDVSPERNLENYGSITPPIYDPRMITSDSIVMFSAVNDVIADPQDVNHLIRLLPKPVLHFNVTEPTFGHYTFVYGDTQLLVPYITEPVLQVMTSYYPDQ